MAVLTWPAELIPAEVSWELRFNTMNFESPLSKTVQTYEIPGARWMTNQRLPILRETDWRTWHAWAAKMRGGAGRCYIGPPHYQYSQALAWTANLSARRCDSTAVKCDSTTELINQEHRAPADLDLLIDGGGQTGGTLVCDGWVGAQSAFGVGDYISYDAGTGRQLHMIVSDVTAADSGRCEITIEPPIRTSPADNVSVEFVTPTCIMRFASDDGAAIRITAPLLSEVSVELVEVFSA